MAVEESKIGYGYLSIAQMRAQPPSWILLLFALVGVLVIGTGIYAIMTRRAIVGRRQKLVLRLFGVEEITGTWAVITGAVQCFVGGMCLLAALAWPSVAGLLKEMGLPDGVRGQIAVQQPNGGGHALQPSLPPSEAESPLLAGNALGERYRDDAPAGGLLVGLRCATGSNWGGAVQAVQPIYQVGSGYVLGERHGKPGGQELQSLARPGYAVGAIHARAGLVLNALQLVFYRIKGQRLDPDDWYESAWVGSEGGSPRDIDGHGAPITGLFGTWADDIVSIGIAPGDKLPAPIPLATDSPPDGRSEPPASPAAPDLSNQRRKAAYARPGMRAGSEEGNPFEDEAPEGGLLVGLRCAKGKNWGGALRAVQPIYQVGARYVLGKRHGKAGGEELQVLAKPGYAVGAIHARAGLVLDAVQVVFYRIDGDRLNANDRYESAWVGSPGGGLFNIDARGDPIVGVFGTWDDDLVSLGCSPTRRLAGPIPLAEGPPP